MNGHKVIAYRLANYAGLTALVSTRITPNVIDQPATFPAVTFQQLTESTERSATTNPGYRSALFQVTSWDRTLAGARAVADQVKLALDRLRSQTVNGVSVDDCFLAYPGGIDLFDFEARIHYVALDFRLHFRE